MRAQAATSTWSCSGRRPTTTASGTQVRAAASARAHLPGALFGDGYRGLQVNARCYVHATEVGGTHPALIEAMGAGNLCLVLDTPENREVAGDGSGLLRRGGRLAERLRWASALDPGELAVWREGARQHAAERYSWEVVGGSYLTLLRGAPTGSEAGR